MTTMTTHTTSVSQSTVAAVPGEDIDSPAEFDAMPEADRADLTRWIGENIQPAARHFHMTSYGLKHLYEHDRSFYVTNGQFKGAMLAAGYQPRDTRAKNWEFKIRKPQRVYDAYFNRNRFKQGKEQPHVAA